jgi:predicted P-loop ATPase
LSDAEWLPPVASPLKETTLQSAVVPISDWRSRLLCEKRTGEPRAALANAVLALRAAPEWQGVLGFNEFSLSTIMLRPSVFGGEAGSEWTDHEDRLTADWLQHQRIFVNVDVTAQAVQVVARDHTFHPVRQYLESLVWDGTQRAGGWLSLYLGVDPTEYSVAVGERWLRSAVARIFQPGVKADCCLILEGVQGLKKSTALRTLAVPWFSDEIADLGSKDAALQTRGVWVIEIAELHAMSQPEVARTKSFMSRGVDRFRPPYGRRLLESPRQCVFAGSVNHSSYLKDETGGRRFWPVACTRILIEELQRDRDQIWAESVATYRAGQPWWLDKAELVRDAEAEQAERFEGSAWDTLISDWLAERKDGGFTSTSVHEVLEMAIKKPPKDFSRADEMRAGAALRAAGWERFRQRTAQGLRWAFRPVNVPSSGEREQGGNC